MLMALIMMYLKDAFMIYILFSLFNVFTGAGFTKGAFYLRQDDKKIVLVAPIAYVAIALLSYLPIIGFLFAGFFGSVLSLIAFILIFAHYKGLLRKFM